MSPVLVLDPNRRFTAAQELGAAAISARCEQNTFLEKVAGINYRNPACAEFICTISPPK
jgi:hypothetical protein